MAVKGRGAGGPGAADGRASLAVPAALCGCDVLAVAETGSGKTLAFGWPLLAHVAAQEASRGSEPVALVVVPTRELCEQVYRELTRHAKYAPRSVGTVAVFGGAGKWEMARELKKAGSLLWRPGRMMEFIQGRLSMQARCTFWWWMKRTACSSRAGPVDVARAAHPASRQAIFTTW